MTGKEYLCSKTAEEMYDTMNWLFNTYGRSSTDSRTAIIEWLKAEGVTDKVKIDFTPIFRTYYDELSVEWKEHIQRLSQITS